MPTWQIVVSVYVGIGVLSSLWNAWPIGDYVREIQKHAEESLHDPLGLLRYIVPITLMFQFIWDVALWPYENVYRKIRDDK